MTTAYHAAYVLDASVAVKWFTKRAEQDQATAFALRDRHAAGQCQFIVPEFFFLEVLSALRRHAKASEADAHEALELLEDMGLKVEPMDRDRLRKTTAISWAYGAGVYDAAYVALAETVGYPFLTADEALVRQMRGHSIVLRLTDLNFGTRGVSG